MIVDKHVHSPFCPHGTKDTFEDYIERAIELGIEEITFTEHAPLPAKFPEPIPEKDSGMKHSDLPRYLKEAARIKDYFKNSLRVNIGLEVDFIEGFEKETKELLDETGPYLDDSILSIHFIKDGASWHCIDYSADMFGNIISSFGSAEAVYQRYYDTVEKAVEADLGIYKPKRIGHLTLIHKFQKSYPVSQNFDSQVYRLIDKISGRKLEMDYNGAGFAKPLCREPYPPERFARYALELGIPLVYGSDAHQAKDLGQGFEQLLPDYREKVRKSGEK
ncbi:histidinol-phosphatase HisJ [Peribacillus saganii]|uniref:Histidinol-phosphatase n=1 Tax=Peribacillus saganii TaxID=2303992 RepID=A0A372LIM6_9BACI|nr:histidinol-phosphatase HisJ [Peribacillus saganii]RFU66155.1 histidinol-phosphatase HisJ [Peribacillus saganii]